MKAEYSKPEIEVIEMELEGAVMADSYKLPDEEYNGPAGAPKHRRSFWGEDE